MIEISVDTSGVADLQQKIASLRPRVLAQLNSALPPLLHGALETTLKKYFSGSAPARGPGDAVLTMRSGNLYNSVLESLTSSLSDDGVTFSFGSSLPYAAIQEFGGYAGFAGPFKKQAGHRPYLPARPYLAPAMNDLQSLMPGLLKQVLDQVETE